MKSYYKRRDIDPEAFRLKEKMKKRFQRLIKKFSK